MARSLGLEPSRRLFERIAQLIPDPLPSVQLRDWSRSKSMRVLVPGYLSFDASNVLRHQDNIV